MKYLLFLLISFLYSAQNIIVEIPEKEMVEFSSGKTNQICFNIKNNSDDEYKIAFDKAGFSTAENESVDDPYLGIPGFKIFKNDLLIKPIIGSYGYQIEPLESDTIGEKELVLFIEKNKHIFKKTSDFFNSYKINRRVITLKPKESKSICMNINLPIYKSFADDGSLLYNLENGETYNFQIFLNIPEKAMKKYILNSGPKSKVFIGTVVSNKIPFIYREPPE